jgi:hypothetical protein
MKPSFNYSARIPENQEVTWFNLDSAENADIRSTFMLEKKDKPRWRKYLQSLRDRFKKQREQFRNRQKTKKEEKKKQTLSKEEEQKRREEARRLFAQRMSKERGSAAASSSAAPASAAALSAPASARAAENNSNSEYTSNEELSNNNQSNDEPEIDIPESQDLIGFKPVTITPVTEDEYAKYGGKDPFTLDDTPKDEMVKLSDERIYSKEGILSYFEDKYKTAYQKVKGIEESYRRSSTGKKPKYDIKRAVKEEVLTTFISPLTRSPFGQEGIDIVLTLKTMSPKSPNSGVMNPLRKRKTRGGMRKHRKSKRHSQRK